MALKVPQGATLKQMDALIAAYLDGCTLRLYSNNHTPADTDDASDYTECTFPGYAEIPLTGLWSAAALNVDDKASTECAEQTFTGGVIVTPESIYGIYVTDVDDDLAYAELNPGGVVLMSVAGQEYSYTPRFTERSEV